MILEGMGNVFANWLKKTGCTQMQAAERLRRSQSLISKLCNGGRPSVTLAIEIEEWTDGEVPALSWYREDAA